MSVLIDNISSLVTNDAVHGGVCGVIPDAAVVLDGDRDAWVGPRSALDGAGADHRLDAGGRAVVPGFVESHSP